MAIAVNLSAHGVTLCKLSIYELHNNFPTFWLLSAKFMLNVRKFEVFLDPLCAWTSYLDGPLCKPI